MTNEEFLNRAEIATDAIATTGKLNPVQADRFIDFVFDLSVFRSMARLERFRAEELHVDKIGVADRVAVPAAEGVDPGVRNGVNHSRVTLKPQEIMVPFSLTDRYRRINIEGESVDDHVVRMMADTLANNLDQLYLDGNLLGPAINPDELPQGGSDTLFVKDTYFALMDGLLKQAEAGNVVDAGNAPIGPALFNDAILAMPVKFRRNRTSQFMLSPDHEQAYRESISGRATPLGDTALQSMANLTPYGRELMPVPLWERNPKYVEDSVANTDGTTATQLTNAPITNLVLTPQALGSNETAAFLLATDYTQDLTLGTWTRLGAAGIGSGETVKATYNMAGRMVLTQPSNLIVAIGLDITIERDRNIHRRVNEWVITVAVDFKLEEVSAAVLVKNIADPTL